MEKDMYKYIPCKTVANKVSGRFPYKWDVNVYRGCEHGCKYCYAIYSHKYIDSEDFFSDVYVKDNVVEMLDRQLSSPRWKGELINLGGVTDSYQPAEKTCRIMPEILRLMIKYRNPIIISTKSDLILRDYDLIDELSRLTSVNVAATVTCMDERVRTSIEPNSSPSGDRLRMLKEIRRTNASVGVHAMPLIPYITDTPENIEWIFSEAREIGAHYVLTSALGLRGETRKYFMNFIYRQYPNLYGEFLRLYRSGGADREYKKRLYETVRSLMRKYSLSDDYMGPIMKRAHTNESDVQLSLF